MERPIGFRLFDVMAMIFVTMLLISNTIAVKIISIGGFILPAGIICFPIAYIFNDVLVECYGYKKTRRVIWWGFFCLGIMSGFYWLASVLPPAAFWNEQPAFQKFFQFAPRIAAASFVAYLVGSFLNAAVMSRMKVKMKGKHLWMRTIGSTIIGEGADSVVFNFVAFLGVFGIKHVAFIALSGFVLKTVYEVIATPVTYIVIGWLKRIEGVDIYDTEVSYNPFLIN